MGHVTPWSYSFWLGSTIATQFVVNNRFSPLAWHSSSVTDAKRHHRDSVKEIILLLLPKRRNNWKNLKNTCWWRNSRVSIDDKIFYLFQNHLYKVSMEIAGYQYTAHLNIKCFMMETFPTLERTCREGNLKKKEVISESIQNMNAFRRASK